MEYVIKKIRNGIFAACALCIIISIISVIYYLTIDESLSHMYRHNKVRRQLDLKTLLENKPISFNSTWISDDEILTQDDDGNIILLDVNKSIKSVVAYSTMQHFISCHSYELSADKKYLLISYGDDESLNYLSTKNYDVINIKTGKQITLIDSKHKPRNIMAAKWSPKGSSLAIVDNYNIYYIPTASKPNHCKQLTFHGSKDVYCGIPDWVYEEEIFHSHLAMWFSNQGTHLAYAIFNEASVPSVYLPRYGIPDTMYDQYSRIYSYHYPKVNDPNPVVELFVQQLNDMDAFMIPVSIKPTENYNQSETILYYVAWSDEEHLFAMWMNRIQNKSQLVHYHISNKTAIVKEAMEFNQENGWLNFYESFLINPEQWVALIYSVEQEGGDSFGHVCVIKSNGELRPLTSGKYEVTKLIKWDFESNYIYYLANTEHSSEEQHVYRIQVHSEQQKTEPECLTCNTGCSFSFGEFSEKNTYFAHICQGPMVPYVNIMQTNGDHITEWKTNKNLNKALENVALPRVLFLTVPLVDNYEARVKLLIPPKKHVSPDDKYPLLLYSDGGPALNMALDKFQMDLNTFLSVNHNVIIAQVDGRGTNRRGRRTLFANYKNLGTCEIDDQITVAKFLQSHLSYVDKNKIGIWGWSFGGYVAGMVLARDKENIFKCGLSVAPVTDWMYYNSVYTERFMGMYAEHFESYRNASLIENAEGMRNKNYMVIHGTFDHTIHFQHSAMLSKELQHKSITFKQQLWYQFINQTIVMWNVFSKLKRIFHLIWRIWIGDVICTCNHTSTTSNKKADLKINGFEHNNHGTYSMFVQTIKDCIKEHTRSLIEKKLDYPRSGDINTEKQSYIKSSSNETSNIESEYIKRVCEKNVHKLDVHDWDILYAEMSKNIIAEENKVFMSNLFNKIPT